MTASALGLTDYDAGMDDLSADELRGARARRPRLPASGSRRWPDADLTADERIDRDLALAMLRGRLIDAEWQGWKRDPLTYSGPALNGVFLLFLHRLRPEQELVDAAVSRLAQVPTVFEQGRANLDPALAHPLIVERALASAQGGRRYVRDLLPAEVHAVELAERLRSAGAAAGAGLRRLGRVPRRASRPRRAAPGSSARSATAGRSGSARRCPSTRAACASRASPSSTGWTPRCARSRSASRGTPDWREVIERRPRTTR